MLEALQEIGALLRELPPKAAQAFLMAAVCEVPSADVATELGISPRMVRKYVAQVMLRCMLTEAGATARALQDPTFA